MKELYYNNYKSYINVLSTLPKRAKEIYFTNFFNETIKDIKKTWKGIETLASMKQKNNDTPSLSTKNEKYINDPVSIARTVNFFTSVAETVHSKIKFSNKSLIKFLSSEISDSVLIASKNQEEIYKIITFLNASKSCGPNSIPTKVLHLFRPNIIPSCHYLQLIILYRSISLLFSRQPKLSPFTKRILN